MYYIVCYKRIQIKTKIQIQHKLKFKENKMVLPDWMIELLEAIGLKKKTTDTNSQAQLQDDLRDLNSQRDKEYRELDHIERRLDILKKSNSRQAISDINHLKEDFELIEQNLGQINTQIRQVRVLLRIKQRDDIAMQMQRRAVALKEAIVKAEHATIIAGGINVDIDDVLKNKNTDPTANTITPQVSQEEICSKDEKNIQNESENTNITV